MAEPKTPLETPEEEVVEQEVTPEETPPTEEPPKEETPEAPAPEEETEEEEAAPPSRRETLRIQQILEKRRQEEAPKTPEVPAGLDYSKALDADPEVIKSIEAEAQRRQDVAYAQGRKEAEAIKWETRLEVDYPKVEAKYPHLDRNSDTFHEPIWKALSQGYLNTVGYDPDTKTVTNPNVRYVDYIDGMMELADEIAGEKVSKTTQNITKQAAQTGLRPDGSAAKRLNLNKDAHEMSDEELAAKLASFGM